jgi:hypothetical protein
LTRAAYGPGVPRRLNARRLALSAGITVPSLRAQTTRDLTWLVLIDPADPLLEERRAAFASSGLPIIFAPAEQLARSGWHDRPWGPWAKHIEWGDVTLTTRLDDDDAFAPWAMERVQRASRTATERVVWTLPSGYRICGRLAYQWHWASAQFVTLQVPPGDQGVVYDRNHGAFAELGPMLPATEDPAWLWIRHRQVRSRLRLGPLRPHPGRREWPVLLTPAIRAAFPVNWRLIESL